MSFFQYAQILSYAKFKSLSTIFIPIDVSTKLNGDKVSSSRTQHSASGEARTSNLHDLKSRALHQRATVDLAPLKLYYVL